MNISDINYHDFNQGAVITLPLINTCLGLIMKPATILSLPMFPHTARGRPFAP